MSVLVRYRCSERELARTVRGGEVLEGSVHHPEMSSFIGLVTREHPGAIADIVIFPPGRSMVHLAGVPLGDGAGMAEVISG